MLSRLLAAAVVLLAVACAHAPEQTEPAPDWGIASASTVDTFEIGGTGHNWGVKVTEDEILGVQPDFALSRKDGEINGRALGVPVVVGFHGDQGAGVYRGAPFEVYVEHTPAGLHVSGIFGGAVSNFELSTEHINGRVGICGYDVRWNGKYYSGFRGCGQQIEAVTVSLPATMAKWSDVEVAGALGLLMNVGGTDPGRPARGQLGRIPRAPGGGPDADALLPDGLLRPQLRGGGGRARLRGVRRGSALGDWTSCGVRSGRAPAVRGLPGLRDVALTPEDRLSQVASAGPEPSPVGSSPSPPSSGVWARGLRMPSAFIFL